MLSLYATGVGSGIAIGKARIIRRPDDALPEYFLQPEEVQPEVERLRTAWRSARSSLKKALDSLPADAADEVAAFLSVQLLMLDDPVLIQAPIAHIRTQQINAESALNAHAEKLAATFAAMDDPYLSSKSRDITQVIDRVLGDLLDAQDALSSQPAGRFDGEIIVSHDLTPADTVALKQHRIGAFVTNLGGPISHTAILARSMGIPAIVGMHDAIQYLRTGDLLVIDGKNGTILVDPDKAALAAYARRREKIARRTEVFDALLEAEAVTLDGHKIELLSNIELPEDLQQSLDNRAQGVGLYRTEFLFMNRPVMPDEQEQFEAYTEIVRRAAQPVTIRTLDLGADKQVDGGRPAAAMATNPALGRRAIRLCLHEPGLFKPQLRAIYRASAFGQVQLMIPMLSSVEELGQVYKLLVEVRRELDARQLKYDPELPVGGMIEVPAAAVSADLFAGKLDFLSIGTNDLIQYTLAIDRIDDDVNYLYDPLHPSVLRLIKHTIEAGQLARIPVSLCGEMAGDPRFTRILLGVGLRQFSMAPGMLPLIKQQIRLTDTSRHQVQVDRLLHTVDPEQQRQLLARINA